MRTAQEIYEAETLKQLGNNPNGTRHEIVLGAINAARKDVIDICAGLLNPDNSERMIKKMLALKKELK